MPRRLPYKASSPSVGYVQGDGTPSQEDMIGMANDLSRAEKLARESASSVSLSKKDTPKPNTLGFKIRFSNEPTKVEK
jgi:hypothetical protein